MPAAEARALTTPDLVLLSLLAERPLHGYQANIELGRREVRDGAGISRPQVDYSLEKLARLGLIRAADSTGHPFHEAVWMVTLLITQFRTELRWLQKVAREAHRRAPARQHYVSRGR